MKARRSPGEILAESEDGKYLWLYGHLTREETLQEIEDHLGPELEVNKISHEYARWSPRLRNGCDRWLDVFPDPGRGAEGHGGDVVRRAYDEIPV